MDTTSAGRCCPPAARRGRRPCRTRGVSDLIASTALDRRLGIAFLIPHGGAPLPLLAGRPQMYRDVFLADAAKAASGTSVRDALGRLWYAPAGSPFPPHIPPSPNRTAPMTSSTAATLASRLLPPLQRSGWANGSLAAAWLCGGCLPWPGWPCGIGGLRCFPRRDNSSRAAVPWGFCHTVEPAADVSHQGMTNDEHGLTQTRDDFRPRIGRRALSSSRDHVRGGRET
jgi:hypothetical protein